MDGVRLRKDLGGTRLRGGISLLLLEGSDTGFEAYGWNGGSGGGPVAAKAQGHETRMGEGVTEIRRTLKERLLEMRRRDQRR